VVWRCSRMDLKHATKILYEHEWIYRGVRGGGRLRNDFDDVAVASSEVNCQHCQNKKRSQFPKLCGLGSCKRVNFATCSLIGISPSSIFGSTRSSVPDSRTTVFLRGSRSRPVVHYGLRPRGVARRRDKRKPVRISFLRRSLQEIDQRNDAHYSSPNRMA
jgi:hypothetical protein